jgi:hypothetical protein
MDNRGKSYPVHHRIPLEFAHLLHEMNINAQASRDVEEVATIIDRHFERWYHKVYHPDKSLSALNRAQEQAIREIEALVKSIQGRN